MINTVFIEECKKRANKNRLGKIIIDGVEEPITNSTNLQNLSIDSGCYVDGHIIGSVYAKCLKASFIKDIAHLEGKSIQAQIGVKYNDLNEEYINMGKYIVERPNNEITADMSQIIAYDSLYINLDKKYVCGIDYSQGNITVEDLYVDVCNQLGLEPNTTTLTNGNISISDNPFTNGEKNRTVLQTIAKITCSFVDIDSDNNKVDLKWLNQSETPDYIFYKNDYVSLEGGQVICGPINCLIIKNSQIDDENVTIRDVESIALNGEHSIIISEDFILHNAELREQAITSIWNKVHGIKYVDSKIITYYGKPFLKLGDKIRIYISDTEYFDTYVLKHNFSYDGTFASTIGSPTLTEQEIKTKQDITLQEALKNTQIDIDKQKQIMTSTIEKVDSQGQEISIVKQDTNSVKIQLSDTKLSVDSLKGTVKNMNFNFTTENLEISSNGSINKTLINNDGIQVLNHDKLVAILNNNGTGIDTLIVTGTAQLGYLRFMKTKKDSSVPSFKHKNKDITSLFYLVSNIQNLDNLKGSGE